MLAYSPAAVRPGLRPPRAQALALVAALGIQPAPVVAAPDGREALQEIVVTGRRPQTIERVATVRVLDAADIALRGARTLDEAIELLPGVNVRVGGDGTPRVDVRGYRTRHVKLLLNGVPFGDPFDGQFDPTLIPTESIARIKLTTGASSTLYGDGAMGAVINVITRQGGDGHAASSRAEYGSGGHHRVSGSYAWGDASTAVHVTAGRFARDAFPLPGGFDDTGLESGGLRENSDRERNHAYFNLYRALTPSLDFGLTFTYADGAYGQPGTVVDDDADAFANRPRWQRVDDQEVMSVQATLAFDPAGPWSNRAWTYLTTVRENTNRYSDPFNPTLADPHVRGTFADDADSRVYGVHDELRFEHAFGGALTFMVEARQERYTQDCLTRDIPLLAALPPPVPTTVPLASATSATLDFNYLATNNFGATNSAGDNEPIARLTLANNATGGVDFRLQSLAINNFFSGGGSGPPIPEGYLSRLYMLSDPTLDISDWAFVDDPASEASAGGAVNFAAPGLGDVVNNYDFRARFGWQRPGGGGGLANPLFDGESALWSVDNASIAELLGFEAVSSGGRPNAFAAIELRQADALGFWGPSEASTGGPGGLSVFLVAPTSATALVGPAPVDPNPVINVPPAGGACGSGGDGSGGGTPTRFDSVTFALRPFSQDRALEVATAAVELSVTPVGRLELVAGYARHLLNRDDGSSEHFGSFSTGASYPLGPALDVKAGVARKIRMPSVRQLYDTLSGDPALSAETSMTYEVGGEYRGLEPAVLGLTVYRSDVDNFIDRDPVTETFANNQRYRFQGVELTAEIEPVAGTRLGGSYSYLDASDRANAARDELQYRPRHKLAFQASQDLAWGARAVLSGQHVGGEFYFSRQGIAATRTLDAYTLLALRLEQPLAGGRVRLYAGADNLLDVAYEEAYGLPQAGRFVYGGVELSFF